MAFIELRAAAQQALEALESDPNAVVEVSEGRWKLKSDLAIAALRAALAEPVQEPLQSAAIHAAWSAGYVEGEKAAWSAQPQDQVAQISANRVIAAIEEWKSLWRKVPPFASKVNRATREAITVSHNPLFALLLDAQAAKQMPKGCTTPSGCQQHGCHGECLPIEPQRPAEPVQEPAVNHYESDLDMVKCRQIAREYAWPNSNIDSGNLYWALHVALRHVAPPQRPVEPVQDHFPDATKMVHEPVQEAEMRRCPRCWEPMFPPQPTPLTVERLRDALVSARIVPPAAVEDPDGYDDGVTLHRIEALHRRLA